MTRLPHRHPSAPALLWLICLALWIPACTKKQAADKKEPAAPPATMTTDDPRTPPARRRPAVTSSVDDPDLKRALAEELGPKARKEFDAIKQELEKARASFDATEKGKQIYQQFLAVIGTLRTIGDEARHGRFEKISGLAMTGYIMGLMAVYQLKDVATDLARKAIQAGKKLRFDAAKKLATQGKSLLSILKVVKALQAKYAATLATLLKSKSVKLRLATCRALAKAHPKAPKLGKAAIRKLLEGAAAREKDPQAKTTMDALVQGLK